MLWNRQALHDNKTLTSHGKQALGIIPIKRPEPPKTPEEKWKESDWWNQFKGVSELQGDGTVSWIINNVIPEGVTIVTGMAKDGKSFLVASFVKAITSGQPWLGRIGFEVPEALPVLWLAAESGDSGLKIRCEKFKITKDKSRFICRTLTQGMVGLDDPELEKLVRAMKPVVVLETLVRFGDGEDEDDAGEANKIGKMLFRLITWGARGVLCISHSRKDLKRNGIDLDRAIRGSGDYAAQPDAIWCIVRDETLYRGGLSANEVKMQGWGRDFQPYPMRLALTKKAPKDLPASVITLAPGIVSIIDEAGDLGWIDVKAKAAAVVASETDLADTLKNMIQDNPSISLRELARAAGLEYKATRTRLKRMGWEKGQARGETWKKVKVR